MQSVHVKLVDSEAQDYTNVCFAERFSEAKNDLEKFVFICGSNSNVCSSGDFFFRLHNSPPRVYKIIMENFEIFEPLFLTLFQNKKIVWNLETSNFEVAVNKKFVDAFYQVFHILGENESFIPLVSAHQIFVEESEEV
ncbi:MAG: hypothetical protein KM296_00335 [Brockia lithotrophica]|nr:hypothetical protein [Brockia lithotrophica]